MTPKRQRVHLALGAVLFAGAVSFVAHAEPTIAAPEPPEASEEIAFPGPVKPPAPAPAPVVAAAPKPAAAAAPASSATQRSYLRPQQAKKAPVASAPSVSPLRIALIGGLVAGLGVWALLQRRRHKSVARTTRSDMEIVSSLRVSSKAQVVVVNVGGRKVLLGVTDSEVNRLAWLDGELEGDGESLETFDDELPLAKPGSKAQVVAPAARVGAEQSAKPARFRDALLGALGQNQKRTQAEPPAAADAALAIADSTQDVVVRSPRVAVPASAPDDMVDVEGQAKGLVLRLQKRA
ncbi:MAG: flagellar biosynthetic protein FliO [Polyangiaceae bacterium]